MKPQGHDGFEGLFALALDRLLERPFRVFKSGRQPGGDLHCTTLAVTVECKRYKDDIPLNDLLAAQAKAAQDGAELWVVATTTEVRSPDNQMLKRNGEILNLAVGFLDWPENDKLPPLAVVLGCAPDEVADFLADNILADKGEMIAALNTIAANPLFSSERHKLKALFDPAEMGYGQARVACIDWLSQRMGSRRAARDQFGQPVNVTDSEARLVRRSDILQALQDWWHGWSHDDSVAALTGLEGIGKTWAALSWWAENATTLPLTLLVMAHQFAGGSAGKLLAEALARQKDAIVEEAVERWMKRIDAWTNRPSRVFPRLLIILDGLNENPSAPWAQLIGELRGGKYRGHVAVLVTSRPQYFKDNISPLPSGRNPIPVGPYSDQELKTALALHGLSEKSIAPGLVKHLRKPRYFRIAAAHLDKGDITIEQLLYLDWRDRRTAKVGGRAPLTEFEFERLIRTLAAEALETLEDGSRKIFRDLGKRVGEAMESNEEKDGRNRALSEIVEGGLMEVYGTGHVLQPTRLYYGLGLLLKYETTVAWEDASASLDDVINGYLDQMRGMDYEAHIVRAASILAMFDDACPPEVRHRLRQEWLTAQNLSEADGRALYAHLPADPTGHMAVLRWLWCKPDRSGPAIAMLFRALERWNAHADVRRAILEECNNSARQIPNLPATPQTIKLRDLLEAEFADVQTDMFRSHDLGVALTSLDWAHLDPLLALARWAAAESRGRARLHAAVAWLGRRPRFDGIERRAAVENLCSRLSRLANGVAIANILTATLLNGDGGRQGHELPGSSPPRWALDPDATPPPAEAADLRQQLDVWWRNGREILPLTEAMRRDPAGFVGMVDDWLAHHGLSSGESSGELLSHTALIINQSRPHLRARWKELIKETHNGLLPRFESRLLLPLLMGESAEEQCAMMRLRRTIFGPLPGLRAVAQRLSPEAAAELARSVNAMPSEQLPDLLNYLTTQRPALDDDLRQMIVGLTKAEEVTVRDRAQSLIEDWNDQRLGKMMVASGWAWPPERSFVVNIEDEIAARNLVRFGSALSYQELSRRLPLQELAWAVAYRGAKADELALLAADINHLINTILDIEALPPAEHDMPTDTKVMGALAQHYPEKMAGWADSVSGPAGPEIVLRAPPFFFALCEALFPQDPERAAALWRMLRGWVPPSRRSRRGVTTSSLDFIVGIAPDHPLVHQLWQVRLDDAVTDEAILDIAIAAALGGKREWLQQAVEADLAAAESWRHARGFTLAGFDDDRDGRWQSLWSRPAETWVAEARIRAEAAHNRNRWAWHWFRRFLDHPDTAEAWVAYRLFLHTVDRRSSLWLQAEINTRRDDIGPRRRMHHGLNHQSMVMAMEGWDDEYKSRWLGHTIPFGAVWPWLT